jgi:transposase InsO family protein
MAEDRHRALGLFRFNVINPLLNRADERSLKDRVAEQAAKVWTMPDGRLRQYSADTIEDWYYDYRKHGFDALVNPPRKDRGTHRVIDKVLREAIDRLLTAQPTLKSTVVIRRLDEQGLERPSDATLYRYLRQLRGQYQAPKRERKAFEAPYAGHLYQTDIMYGPHVMVKQANGQLRKQQTYLLGILDDYSRLLCHGEFFLTQDLSIYLTVLEKAIRKRGIPDKIYCDNGKVFLSDQVQRIGAEIGTRIVHTKVRDAAAKGKIERFFRTVRDEVLTQDLPTNLDNLNQVFAAWAEMYNQRKHSGINCSPLEKWLASPRPLRMLQEDLHNDDLFFVQVTRKVKKDGTFQLLGTRYETSYVHAGRKITVRYNPQDRSRVHVYLDTDYLGVCFPLNAAANHNLPRQSKDS